MFHWRLPVLLVTVKSRRLRRTSALGDHQTPRAGCGLRVVASVRAPPSHRRLKESDRPGGVKPTFLRMVLLLAETPGLTPPVRSDWLRPPTRRGIPDRTVVLRSQVP